MQLGLGKTYLVGYNSLGPCGFWVCVGVGVLGLFLQVVRVNCEDVHDLLYKQCHDNTSEAQNHFANGARAHLEKDWFRVPKKL